MELNQIEQQGTFFLDWTISYVAGTNTLTINGEDTNPQDGDNFFWNPSTEVLTLQRGGADIGPTNSLALFCWIRGSLIHHIHQIPNPFQPIG